MAPPAAAAAIRSPSPGRSRTGGTLATEATDWTDRVYLSDSPTLDARRRQRGAVGFVTHRGARAPARATPSSRTFATLPPAWRASTSSCRPRPVDAEDRRPDEQRAAPHRSTSAPRPTCASRVIAPASTLLRASRSASVDGAELGAAVWAGTRPGSTRSGSLRSPTPARPGSELPRPVRPRQRAAPRGRRVHPPREVTLPAGIRGRGYIHVRHRPAGATGSQPQSDGLRGRHGARTTRPQRLARRHLPRAGPAAATPYRRRQPPAFSGETVTVTWTVDERGHARTRARRLVRLRLPVARPVARRQRPRLGSSRTPARWRRARVYPGSGTVTLPIDAGATTVLARRADVPRWRGPLTGAGVRCPSSATRATTSPSRPLRVTLTPPPDLRVSVVSIPERVVAGQLFDVTYTVTNAGAATRRPAGVAGRPRLPVARPVPRPAADRFLGFHPQRRPDGGRELLRGAAR